MKLHYVNPKNVAHMVPSWAIDPFQLATHLDAILSKYQNGKILRWDSKINFWVEFIQDGDGFRTRIAEPDENDERTDISGHLYIQRGNRTIQLPLNDILRGAPSVAGTHSVYFHTINTDVPLTYVGLTKQRWFDRLAQHESSARNGSNLIFHRALREHDAKHIMHLLFLTSLNEETAMAMEEEFVELLGLYPKGLNMIPGGNAGLRYLHTLGIKARNFVDRDKEVERLAEKTTIAGRPNPLCAARWIADQDFVNRVICGHSGRLSSDQVRSIRMLFASGKAPSSIAEYINDNVDRVEKVIAGKVYARVA